MPALLIRTSTVATSSAASVMDAGSVRSRWMGWTRGSGWLTRGGVDGGRATAERLVDERAADAAIGAGDEQRLVGHCRIHGPPPVGDRFTCVTRAGPGCHRCRERPTRCKV